VTHALELIAGVMSALALLAMVALVLRRVVLARARGRREDRERALRPLALALVDGEEPEIAFQGGEARVFAAILGRYARKLRGESSARIAAFFERRGDLDRELRRLRSRRSMTRATAAFTLGDMGSPRAIAPLIAALDDRARDVRAAAARSLGRLEAEDAVPRLVRSLAGQEVPRTVAAHALLSIGSSAPPRLRGLVGTADPAVRATAIELIGFTADPDHGELLGLALRDTSGEVRAAAARSLGRLGARGEAAALRRALEDPAAFVRTAAAHALGRIGDRDAVEPLVRQAQEDAYDPAQAAAHALAAIDPARAVRAGSADDASAHLLEAAALAELCLA
jgi:HEAT repeat protein